MGARDLSRQVAAVLTTSCICVLALSPPISAQRIEDPNLERHLRNVYVERRAAFELAWSDADEDARARVRQEFATRRRGGVPAVHRISAADFGTLTRILQGESLEAAGAWGQLLADSLDLRVQPGAFEPARGGRGEPLIVRVLPLRSPGKGGAHEVDLSLYWLGPDGREVRARTEPVHCDAFVLPGFEMYIFAPASEPCVWSLVPEVTIGEVSWRGRSVPIACVRDLLARYDRALENGPQASWKDALARGVQHGVRDATWGPLAALLENGPDAPAPPRRVDVADVRGPSVELPPEGAARGLVVVVVPHIEDPEWSFVGRRGDAWRRLPSVGQHLVVTALPIMAARGSSVLELCASLRARHAGLPLTLVVSGGDVGRLPIVFAAAQIELPVERLVVLTIASGDRVPRPFAEGLPTLFVEPLAVDRAREALEGAPDMYRRRHADPPVIVELDLPGEIAAWLADLTE